VRVDATVVRMAIGAALLTLAGKWNWWPVERESAENYFLPQRTQRTQRVSHLTKAAIAVTLSKSLNTAGRSRP
jgi:uncharacterized membrane protein YdfJ with MMPL/SSD domain